MAAPRTFVTRVGMDDAVRVDMIALLNQQLADAFDLYSQTKQAHWNIKGAEFFQVHLLFDKLAEDIEGFVDAIAERAAALGGTALGTVRMASATSRIAEFPFSVISSRESIGALSVRFGALCATTRQALGTAATAGDAVTADLFTRVSHMLDNALWLLEAHLQS